MGKKNEGNKQMNERRGDGRKKATGKEVERKEGRIFGEWNDGGLFKGKRKYLSMHFH